MEINQQLIGSWQLAYYETETNGRINSPNDNKPVYWDLKSDNTYEGKTGNNEILGQYCLEEDKIYFTLSGSEVIGTAWEEQFYDALDNAWNGETYVMPYSLKNDELILNYSNNNTMHFLPRQMPYN
ncbi:MAG: hypothetical protein SVR94_19890 [Pseudomonadota bacterium]|nr:hypothetical protein [Pseudomonadota bacterium]